MVQEEISELLQECNSLRQKLRQQRETINQAQKKLLKFASNSLPKDDLTHLEHYQNQFHIQLINLHDLKHEYRLYEHHLQHDSHAPEGLSDVTRQEHEKLVEDHEHLNSMLDELFKDFEEFVSKPA